MFPTAKGTSFYSSLAVLVLIAVYELFSFFVFPSTFLYLAVLAVCAVVIIKNPKAGILAILPAVMWFERYFTLNTLDIAGHSFKLYFLDFILLFTFVGALVRLLKKELHWRLVSLDKALIIFAVVVSAAYLHSFFAPGVDLSAAFGTFKNYLLYGIFFVLTVLLFRSKEEWQELISWFALGGLGLLFFLFFGLLNGGGGLWSEYTPLSTSGARLIASTHTFYFLLFGFYLAGFYLFGERGKKSKNYLVYLLFSFTLVALTVSLIRHL